MLWKTYKVKNHRFFGEGVINEGVIHEFSSCIPYDLLPSPLRFVANDIFFGQSKRGKVYEYSSWKCQFCDRVFPDSVDGPAVRPGEEICCDARLEQIRRFFKELCEEKQISLKMRQMGYSRYHFLHHWVEAPLKPRF